MYGEYVYSAIVLYGANMWFVVKVYGFLKYWGLIGSVNVVLLFRSDIHYFELEDNSVVKICGYFYCCRSILFPNTMAQLNFTFSNKNAPLLIHQDYLFKKKTRETTRTTGLAGRIVDCRNN